MSKQNWFTEYLGNIIQCLNFNRWCYCRWSKKKQCLYSCKPFGRPKTRYYENLFEEILLKLTGGNQKPFFTKHWEFLYVISESTRQLQMKQAMAPGVIWCSSVFTIMHIARVWHNRRDKNLMYHNTGTQYNFTMSKRLKILILNLNWTVEKPSQHSKHSNLFHS